MPSSDNKALESNPVSLKPNPISRCGDTKTNFARHEAKRGNQYTNQDYWNPMSVRLARAKSLMDQGATWEEIRSQTGLEEHTLQKVKDGEIKVLDSMVTSLKRLEGHKLTLLTHTILDSIDKKAIDKASLLQRVTSSAILIDKRELIEGRPTARMGMEYTPAAIDGEIDALRSEIDAWRTGNIINTSAEPQEESSTNQPVIELQTNQAQPST